MPSLTDNQQISLLIVAFVSCSLSVFGSISIIHLALKNKTRGTYHRLLLCMSFFEILHSTTVALQPFFLPASDDRIWSMGNEGTCSALGFSMQFVVTITTLYNAMLSLNYLLTVRYRMTAKSIKTRVEPMMHGLSISFPLITASVGVVIHLYSELQLGFSCWIGEYPKGCSTDPEVTCISTAIGWIYSGLPLMGTLVFLIFSNLSIYLKVRSTIVKSEQLAQRDDKRNQRQRDVGIQATLYVVAFLSCITWMLVLRTLESMGVSREDEQSVYWLLFMTHMFYPTQGIWNLLIFIRPRYLRHRRREPQQPVWWAMKQAFMAPAVQRGRTSMSYHATQVRVDSVAEVSPAPPESVSRVQAPIVIQSS